MSNSSKPSKFKIIIWAIIAVEALLVMGTFITDSVTLGPLHIELTSNLSEKIKEEFLEVPTMQLFPGSFGQINTRSLGMMLIVDAILIGFAFWLRFVFKRYPGRLQVVWESIISFFDGLVQETLGSKLRFYLPFILTIFLFVWFSNLIGVFPGSAEPTRDLNFPLGLGLVVIAVVHISSIKYKGIKTYLKEYAEPIVFLAPINIVGEMAKGVSLSFRLFGNILGGAIIILVISELVKYLVLPVGLFGFFGIFVGSIQAFVFTMLSLTYIAVAVK